ncbi:MAG TPA: TolC family protein [Pirellulales bacterium]|nr:TolC family protein [Pirellulales bacterium]
MRRWCRASWLAAVLCGALMLPALAQDVQFRYSDSYGNNRYPLAPADGADTVQPVYPGVQTRFQIQAASERVTQPAADTVQSTGGTLQPLPPLPGQPAAPIERQPRLLPPTQMQPAPVQYEARANEFQQPANQPMAQPYPVAPGQPSSPTLAAPQAAPQYLPPAGQIPAQMNLEIVPPGRTPANAEPVQPTWSLEQVTTLAERYNPILRRAQARIESARGDALQAAIYPNPRFDTNNPQVFNGTNSLFNVGFQQQILVKGKFRLQKAAANLQVEQKQYSMVSDRFDMLMAVRQQFYTVLAAERRVQVLTELLNISTGSLKAAQGRVQAGEGTLPEVLLLRTEFQRAQINLKNAQTLLEGERKQLAAVIGLPEMQVVSVVGDFERGMPDFDEQGLRRFVVSENADVQIARRDLTRNQVLHQRARADAYPNITAGPAYQYSPYAPGNQQFWFNIQFDIPTWDRNQGNIRSAQADVLDALSNLGTVQNELLRQAADAISRYRAARERAERIASEILPNARRAQEMVKDGFIKGLLDVSTFLQAQRTLTETNQDYINALEEVWTTAAEIANLLQLERFP